MVNFAAARLAVSHERERIWLSARKQPQTTAWARFFCRARPFIAASQVSEIDAADMPANGWGTGGKRIGALPMTRRC
jgi:hypothetical protein